MFPMRVVFSSVCLYAEPVSCGAVVTAFFAIGPVYAQGHRMARRRADDERAGASAPLFIFMK
jgi:hypothetical protein